MFCTECNCELPQNASFCYQCGKPVNSTSQAVEKKYSLTISFLDDGYNLFVYFSSDNEAALNELHKLAKSRIAYFNSKEHKNNEGAIGLYGLTPISKIDHKWYFNYAWDKKSDYSANALFERLNEWLIQSGWTLCYESTAGDLSIYIYQKGE